MVALLMTVSRKGSEGCMACCKFRGCLLIGLPTVCRKSSEARVACSKAMSQELIWLEGQTHAEGPYFMGKQFSAVDCTLLPWFIRLYILKHYRDYEMPKECKRLVAWWVQPLLWSMPNNQQKTRQQRLQFCSESLAGDRDLSRRMT